MDTSTLDESISVLNAQKSTWSRLPIIAKRGYLRGVVTRQAALAERQVSAAVKAKRVSQGPLAAEDWSNGPYPVLRYVNTLARTLDQLDANGATAIDDAAVRTRPDGQVVVRVFPETRTDGYLYAGSRGEVWMRKAEVTRASLQDHVAACYRGRDCRARVCAVLGAGNVASIPPLDVLTKLYVEGQVCILKLSPVNDYLGPFIEQLFSEFIRDGFVRIVRGDADTGEYLCLHPDVDEIHITGSHRTHDAVVYGPGEEGRRRKQAGTARLSKPITSELGNVSPVIVVPGPWSPGDIRFHAENIATQMINNCGFNCCAAKVLILPRPWPQAAALMDQLRAVLAEAPQRFAYYPGAEDRYDGFVSANRNVCAVGERRPGVLPWTLIEDVDARDSTNLCFTEESFCGVMAQTFLDATDTVEYLREAVRFCNDTLWGTLNACLLIHPETARALGPALEAAIADLRYGAVAVNHWPVLSFVWGSTTWGAFPGHRYDDIQSGIGVVHNGRLFDRPERSVVYGPFRVWPKPAWFVTNRKAHRIFPKLVRLEAEPSVGKALGVMLAAAGA